MGHSSFSELARQARRSCMLEHGVATRTKENLSLPRQVALQPASEAQSSSIAPLLPAALGEVICRLGHGSCAAAHAVQLQRAPAALPTHNAESLLRLQRSYGNRYVQRVLPLSAKAEDDHVAPEVEGAIQAARRGAQAPDGGVRVRANVQANKLQRTGEPSGGPGGAGASTTPSSSSGTASTPPAPTTSEETIARAIAVFMASSASGTRLGQQVLNNLIALSSESEIGYERLKPGVRAESREGLASWGRYDIAVSEEFRQNVLMTSLRLVHEAIHQIQDRPYVDEELTARNLQIDYYAELQRGIPFGSNVYRAAAGTDADLEQQRQRRTSNQLIDHIIDISTYSESLRVGWVRSHIRDWGGVSNRWRHTKGRYIQVLSDEPVGSGGPILDILESESEAGGFRHVVNWVGGGDFDRGLILIRNAFRRGYALFSIQYYQRIKALQQTFGVDLGIPQTSSSH
jgi:hypothetical protein